MCYVTQGAGGSEFVKGVTLGGGGSEIFKKAVTQFMDGTPSS